MLRCCPTQWLLLALLIAGAAALLTGRYTPAAANSADLSPTPRVNPGEPLTDEVMSRMQTATFGAGCFWGVEHRFRQLDGVKKTSVGYAGGHTENPTYQQVCSGSTGHAEVVQVDYDPQEISYEQLLYAFFDMHDPTLVNRQGPDVGTQYRSIVLAHDEDQRAAAQRKIAELDRNGRYARPIATEVASLDQYYLAEDYHQQYVAKHPNRYICH